MKPLSGAPLWGHSRSNNFIQSKYRLTHKRNNERLLIKRIPNLQEKKTEEKRLFMKLQRILGVMREITIYVGDMPFGGIRYLEI